MAVVLVGLLVGACIAPREPERGRSSDRAAPVELTADPAEQPSRLRAAYPLSLSDVADQIRVRLLQLRMDVANGELRGGPVFTGPGLTEFYEARAFEPLWLDANGLRPAADDFMTVVSGIADHGLDPELYHGPSIAATLQRLDQKDSENMRRWADLDLLLSDAFLALVTHLALGRVHAAGFDPRWFTVHKEANPIEILHQVAAGRRPTGLLRNQLPAYDGYAALQAELVRYRQIVRHGGWPDIDPAEPERATAAALALRLSLTGDLSAEENAQEVTNITELRQALMAFQRRHGLTPTGTLDARTVAVLNVPAAKRLRQLELNLERWRWLPANLGDRYILVNIAAFQLRLVEAGASMLDMKVMVGRPYRQTPVFSDQMTYLVLSPYWHVPFNIAVQDKLPLIRKNPDYLRRNHYTLLSGVGGGTAVVDPASVDWSTVSEKKFPFRLRQDPGPHNALGAVKFMFPNKHNVYLHDTPSRGLFEQPERAFSSGCIRVEKPLELAHYLLKDQPGWTRTAIEAAVAKPVERTVMIRKPVPVHLQYWTAWVDETGDLQFRDDLYGRDSLLDRALTDMAASRTTTQP